MISARDCSWIKARRELLLAMRWRVAVAFERAQVIANGRRIGVGARWAPTTAASCAFKASISLASSIDGNSSARLATMAEMVWASSGVIGRNRGRRQCLQGTTYSTADHLMT